MDHIKFIQFFFSKTLSLRFAGHAGTPLNAAPAFPILNEPQKGRMQMIELIQIDLFDVEDTTPTMVLPSLAELQKN